MVQATLASMRHFCSTIPICLIVDGNFDVSDLEREYDLIVLKIPDIRSAQMRRLTTGSFHAKHAAMWEGPFEFYVWMDSDAIVWGDFISQVRTDVDFQIFWSEISVASDALEVPSWLLHFYFDPEKLKQFDSEFEWRGLAYFSAGVFACRRDVISFEQYCNVEEWAHRGPGLFSFGDMGMLNYLVHSKAQRAEIRVATSDLQHVWAHHGKDELIKDCNGNGWHFPKVIARPRVAHFCGRKPFLFDPKAYSRPFTIARLEHHRRYHHEFGAWAALLNEDLHVIFQKLERRVKRFVVG
jgi:hypothetical protein